MSPVPLPGGVPHQQALAQRGAQGVHGVQLPLGVFGAQLLHGQAGGVISGGQAGGEGQNEHVLPRLEQGLQGLGVLGHVDGVGGGQLAAPEAAVKDMGVHLPVVRIVSIGLIVHHKAQRQDLNIELLCHFGGQVGGGVGQNDKIRHR